MADGSVKIDVILDDNDAEKKLDGVEGAAEEAGQGLEKMGDGAKEAEKGLDAVDVVAGNLVADGLSALLGSLKDMAGEFIALADETREYREDMAKLNAAFKDGGSSTEAAKSVYKDFYQILGESDRSVEAANHLAELTKNEKELSQWGTIAAGVTAKFGDSLPIEGLTEAANETAKVGAVTGPLADALNWAGISEDEFNKKLEKCNSEQERASLITETLNKEYSAAAEEYNKLTASTQNARLATAEMEEAQAAIGEAIEPLTAAWTNMRAQAFEAMLPIVQGIVGAFQSISQWMTENPEKAEIIKAVIIALAAAFGVLAVALGIHNLINLVKTAFASLNVTMLANPIVLIVAALAGLVAAFIYLWNNCEAFRNFWIELWEKISSACSSAWEAIQGWFSSAWEFVTGIWDKAKEFFSGVWDGIKEAFSKVESTLSKFFSDAWAKIKEVFATSTIGQYFALCWQTVKDIFAVVKDVLSGNFSDAWTKIKEVFSNWKDFFIEKYEDLIGVFSDIKDKFFEVGDNILKGIWNGIKAGWDWLIGKVKSLASALFGAAQEELDIHSPSRKFAWLGEMMMEGLSGGTEHGGKKAVEAVRTVGVDMVKEGKKAAEKQEKALEDQLERLDEIRTEKNKESIDKQKKQLQKELTLAKERKVAMTTFATTYEKHLADLQMLEEEYSTKHQTILDKLKTDSEAAIANYQSTFESRVQSIKSSLGLFDEVAKKEEASGSQMTGALRSQVRELEKYNEALETLFSRNVSAAFYEEFSQLGVDYLPQLEAINKMTDKQLEDYVSLWEQKTALASEAATKELAGERGRLDAELLKLKDDALDEAETLKSEYNAAMLELLGEITTGMLNAGNAGIEALGETVSGYVETGAALMEGVADGMASKQAEIIQQAVTAVRKAIAAAKAEADIHSPSRVTRDEIGANLALGVAEGWHDKLSALNRSIQGDMSGLTDRLRATVSAENARYGYSHGAPDSGFTELARAVNVQTAGINSLASAQRGGSQRPIVLKLDKRTLGSAVVDVSNAETVRVGTKVTGGAR